MHDRANLERRDAVVEPGEGDVDLAGLTADRASELFISLIDSDRSGKRCLAMRMSCGITSNSAELIAPMVTMSLRPWPRVVDHELQPLRVLHEALHRPEDRGALARQPHAAPRALEQPHAERLFQHLDLLAERRLRHAEPLGRLAEMLLVGDGQEVRKMAQQPEIDHPTLFPYEPPAP